MSQGKCFVIQPFNEATYEKRYADTFEPAIRDAGVEPYRVDRDPGADILISAIEKGIEKSDVCFAEITSDNPNVWYELGYARSHGKHVTMVCEKSRKLPFDIQLDLTRFGGYLMSSKKGDPLCHRHVHLIQPS